MSLEKWHFLLIRHGSKGVPKGAPSLLLWTSSKVSLLGTSMPDRRRLLTLHLLRGNCGGPEDRKVSQRKES